MARAKKRNAVTSLAITRLPAAAGGALLSLTAYGLSWSLSRLWKAPGATALFLLMTMGTTIAATNAMYMQSGHHPAPLFTDPALITASVTPADRPVRRTTRPVKKIVSTPKPIKILPVPVKKVVPAPVVEPTFAQISNKDVTALQNKLVQFGMFEGEVDGFYGPQTADAIRAFERANGLEPVGALTPKIVELVAAATPPAAKAAAVAPKMVPTPVKQKVAALPPSTIDKKPAVDISGFEQNKPKALAADPLVRIASKVANTARNAVVQSPEGDRQIVEKIQRGLSSLGFLQGRIDGVAGEATAKAIRNFEVYYNYEVTGKASPELVDLLAKAGAE